VGGLSKSAEVANVPVALAPSVSDAVRKAEAETQRIAAARAEAAAKQKEHAALQKERKKLAEDASPRRAGTASAKAVAAASRHQTRTAKNSGRVKMASAAR
jgi:UDP-N-acetylglucosamine 2-epimerase